MVADKMEDDTNELQMMKVRRAKHEKAGENPLQQQEYHSKSAIRLSGIRGVKVGKEVARFLETHHGFKCNSCARRQLCLAILLLCSSMGFFLQMIC